MALPFSAPDELFDFGFRVGFRARAGLADDEIGFDEWLSWSGETPELAIRFITGSDADLDIVLPALRAGWDAWHERAREGAWN